MTRKEKLHSPETVGAVAGALWGTIGAPKKALDFFRFLQKTLKIMGGKVSSNPTGHPTQPTAIPFR